MSITAQAIAAALRAADGYVPDAAAALKCSQTNLYRRISRDPALRRLHQEITGRRKLELDPTSAVGGFVTRYGLSRRAAAMALGCSSDSVTRWGSGRATPPRRVSKMIVALDRLTAAGLAWPGELQPDRPRPEPRFPPLYRSTAEDTRAGAP